MRYMLDTNICSYVLRSRPASVKERFDEAGPGALAVSTVVLAELLYGAARHGRAAAIRREIADLTSRLDVVPWDEEAADHYGDIRATLERNGTPSGRHGHDDRRACPEPRGDAGQQRRPSLRQGGGSADRKLGVRVGGTYLDEET